jgi:hypothetical protein
MRIVWRALQLCVVSGSNDRPCLLTPGVPCQYDLAWKKVPYVVSWERSCAEGPPRQRWALPEAGFHKKTWPSRGGDYSCERVVATEAETCHASGLS